MKLYFKFLIFSLILIACGKDEYTLKGRVLYKDKPLEDAEISVYLKIEKDKDTPPIKVSSTDKNGFFVIKLKKGRYFLTGKKKLEEQGEINMLIGNYSETPIELNSDMVLKDWSLQSVKEKESFTKGKGIKGVVRGFNDHRKVRVYVYRDTKSNLKGPDYVSVGKINKDGFFQIDLKDGVFYLSARERKGNFAGPLKEGDKSAEYTKNPIKITKNGYEDIGVLILRNIDSKKLEDIKKTGLLKENTATLKGLVVDENDKPVKNVYVMAYKESEMIGRPLSISLPTDANGNFILNLPHEGKYYIGARTKIGGPAEPGEMIGYIKGSSDKSIFIKKGETKNIKIEVKEIW